MIERRADPASAEKRRQTVAIVSIANHLSKPCGVGFSGARQKKAGGEVKSLSGWAGLAEESGAPPDVDLLGEDRGSSSRA